MAMPADENKGFSNLDQDGAAWAEAAVELAAWADARLVNRRDAWGAYRPENEIGREFTRTDGTKGKLGEQWTVKGALTSRVLTRHFQARGPARGRGPFDVRVRTGRQTPFFSRLTRPTLSWRKRWPGIEVDTLQLSNLRCIRPRCGQPEFGIDLNRSRDRQPSLRNRAHASLRTSHRQ